jgi:hypothetical protein
VQNINPNTILISAGIDSQYDHPPGVVIQVYQNLADHLWATAVEVPRAGLAAWADAGLADRSGF